MTSWRGLLGSIAWGILTCSTNVRFLRACADCKDGEARLRLSRAGLLSGGGELRPGVREDDLLVNAWSGSICDPGDGDVHITRIEKGKQLTDEGKRTRWSFNTPLLGKPQHNYAANKVIQGIVTEIAYCDKR